MDTSHHLTLRNCLLLLFLSPVLVFFLLMFLLLSPSSQFCVNPTNLNLSSEVRLGTQRKTKPLLFYQPDRRELNFSPLAPQVPVPGYDCLVDNCHLNQMIRFAETPRKHIF